MAKTLSPLRYPGGKTSIFPMVTNIIDNNFDVPCSYIEPYAGGGGLALALLFSGKAKEIHLNDLDKSIWAVWNSILNESDSFIKKILETDVTIEEWHKQRYIQANKDAFSDLDLGFSTFFLNRTNRSGIILKAGVIGGLCQNNEKYKLDCRFNKVGLINRINKILSFKDSIYIYNCDAVEFMKKMDTEEAENTCFFIDPPYYEKGASLYTNFYDKNAHSEISEVIASLNNKWLLTYDNASEIKTLYKKFKCYEFNLKYSLARKRTGTELFFCHGKINIPNELVGEVLIPSLSQ